MDLLRVLSQWVIWVENDSIDKLLNCSRKQECDVYFRKRFIDIIWISSKLYLYLW